MNKIKRYDVFRLENCKWEFVDVGAKSQEEFELLIKQERLNLAFARRQVAAAR